MNNTLHIALATDDNYAQHAAAVVQSVLAMHPGRKVQFYFLQPGQPGESLRKLCALAEQGGAGAALVEIPPQWAQRLEHHRYFGTHMWLRMLLPEVLPRLPRVLYLDSDLIVHAPLDELWNLDLQGRALAAVINPLYPHQSRQWLQALGLDPAAYFNSGVLLMDLERMRAEGITEKLVRYATENRERIVNPDQDTLNAVLQAQWLALPPRYNAQNSLYEMRVHELPFTPEEVRAARQQPVIVHFSGVLKPWLDACGHPWRKLYWQCLRGTPWADARPQHPNWRNKLLRHLPYRLRQRIWKWLPQPELKRQVVE